MCLSWYSSTWQLRRKIKEMHISHVKNFRRLKGGELRGVWQESLEKENSSQGLGDHQWWEHMVSPFFFSTISITVGQMLDLRGGIVYCPFSSSSMVLVTFGLEWGCWLLNCGADFLEMGLSFHKWGWLLICWVFRGWPLGGWNTQRLTSPHR